MIGSQGFVQPKNINFRIFAESVETRPLADLKQSLSQLTAYNPEEIQWLAYFQALIKIKEEKDVDALTDLKKSYESLKQRLTEVEPDQYRLLGLALKKIGWIYRKNKDYEKAYFYHNARYLYAVKYGSAVEIHDAAISMDVDSYYLKDLKLSELWLNISREAALKINNPIDRARSLGITDNNLASTLSLQKNFTNASEFIFKSLDSWIEYESLTGPHENKVLWGYYGVGDIFENWARHNKETQQSFTNEKFQAEKSFRKALELAEQRKVSEMDRNSIQDRLNQVLDLA